MPVKPPDRFITYAELAELLSLNITTVTKGELGTDQIPRIRLGRRVLFSFNQVQEWMAARVREAEEAQRQSERAVVDLMSEKRRQRRLIDDAVKTTANVNSRRFER
jgi:excisionase family DNA binding protein